MQLRTYIPSKITPDRITNSVVDVHYRTAIPFVPSIGYLHSIIVSNGFEYIDPLAEQENQNLHSLQHFFINTAVGVKIQIMPNQILFNCIDRYIGWSSYSKVIYTILENLYSTGIIRNVECINLRYISVLPEHEIYKKLNLKFDCPIHDDDNDVQSLSFERMFEHKNIRLIISQESQNSSIDVAVMQDDLDISTTDDTKSKMEELHMLEKALFFSLLTDEYLESLNPQYD